MAVLAAMTTFSSNTFGDPALGDPIPLGSAIAFALWVGFIALLFGGLALALGPVLGRAGSAAVSSLVMVLLWFVSGLDIGGPLVQLSPFHWTVDHIPLVGIYNWGGLALVGVVAIAFLVIGVELFNRRDLGVTAGLSLPHLPKDVLGVRGPLSRAFGEQLPRSLAWGLGMAMWVAVLSSLVGSFSTQIGGDSNLTRSSASSSRASTSARPVAGCSCTSSCSSSRPGSRRRRSSRSGHRTRPRAAWS